MRRLLTVTVAVVVAALTASPGAAPASSAEAVTPASQVRLDPRSVVVDGVRTSYAVLGDARGVPLLLLNGTGSPMSQWDPALLSRLSASRRVIVYDYPGLGTSAPLHQRLSFARLARHAHGLLSVLGVGEADVLGWSMGGFVAQRLAVDWPDDVRRLVLAATNPGGPHAVLGPAWVQEEDSDARASARAYVRTNYPPGARDRGWAFVDRVNRAIADGRYPRDIVPAVTYDAMVRAEDPWLRSAGNLHRIRSLSRPVLVVTGDADVVTPPANSRLIASVLSNATLTLIPGAGHSFLFQSPAASARLISAFLDAS